MLTRIKVGKNSSSVSIDNAAARKIPVQFSIQISSNAGIAAKALSIAGYRTGIAQRIVILGTPLLVVGSGFKYSLLRKGIERT